MSYVFNFSKTLLIIYLFISTSTSLTIGSTNEFRNLIYEAEKKDRKMCMQITVLGLDYAVGYIHAIRSFLILFLNWINWSHKGFYVCMYGN